MLVTPTSPAQVSLSPDSANVSLFSLKWPTGISNSTCPKWKPGQQFFTHLPLLQSTLGYSRNPGWKPQRHIKLISLLLHDQVPLTKPSVFPVWPPLIHPNDLCSSLQPQLCQPTLNSTPRVALGKASIDTTSKSHSIL